MSSHLNDSLLTVKETAEFLNLKVKTIYDYVSSKKIPVAKITPRCIRFKKSDLDAWLDEKSVSPIRGRK